MTNTFTVDDAYFDNKLCVREKPRSGIIDLGELDALVWDLEFANQGWYHLYADLYTTHRRTSIPKYSIAAGFIDETYSDTISNRCNTCVVDHPTRVYIGKLHIKTPGIKHLFIRKLGDDISIDKIVLEMVLDRSLKNVNLVNVRKNAGMAVLRDVVYTESISGFYKELIIKQHIPGTYYGISFDAGSIGFSIGNHSSGINFNIWRKGDELEIINKSKNATNIDTTEGLMIKLETRFKEGDRCCVYLTTERHKYFTTDLMYYHAFIKTGCRWEYIATVKRHGYKPIDNVNSFIEDTGSNNGHLYKRSLLVSNSYHFDTDKNALFTDKKIFDGTDAINPVGTYLPCDGGVIISIGGRVPNEIEIEPANQLDIRVPRSEIVPLIPDLK